MSKSREIWKVYDGDAGQIKLNNLPPPMWSGSRMVYELGDDETVDSWKEDHAEAVENSNGNTYKFVGFVVERDDESGVVVRFCDYL